MTAPEKKDIRIYVADDNPDHAYITAIGFLSTANKAARDASPYLIENANVIVEKKSSLEEFDALIKSCAIGLIFLDFDFSRKGKGETQNKGGKYSNDGHTQFAGIHWLLSHLVEMREQGKDFLHNVVGNSSHIQQFRPYLGGYLNASRKTAEAEELREKEREAFGALLDNGQWNGEMAKPFDQDLAIPIVTARYDENPFWVDGYNLEVYSQDDLRGYEERVNDLKKALRLG